MIQPSRRPVLVATLGTQPQVVTLAVDMLAEDQGVQVQAVYVIHTQRVGWIGEAVKALEKAFAGGRYDGRRCPLYTVLIERMDGTPVRDIRSADDARGAFQTIFDMLKARKAANDLVHFSIAGGRNSMVAYGAASAQILFDAEDRLWHIISTERFEQSRELHREDAGDAQLAQVPVISWNTVVSQALNVWTEDPIRAAHMQFAYTQHEEDRDREAFLRTLTDREWEIVVDYVERGGTDREIARRMGVGHRTINAHMSDIYEKMRSFFSLERDELVDANRTTLSQWLTGFFDRHPDLRTPP